MKTPEELALARSEAIAALQAQLETAVTAAQRALYEGLLVQLQATLDDPMRLVDLLANYQTQVAAPLAAHYAALVLELPALNVAYFQALDVPGYKTLRAPLASFLEKKFGVTATGAVVPGGYVDTLIGDTTAQRALLEYAYTAQASGTGLTAYKAGLEQLVTGGDTSKGLMEQLYAEAGDTFSQADRTLQSLAADRLGLNAAIYQGGLIGSSRPFCVVRNGNCYTRAEITLMGTKADKYGGYTKKEEGLFSGKSEPYDPFIDCGGHSCRHGWHFVPGLIALRMRPDLKEDEAGALVPR